MGGLPKDVEHCYAGRITSGLRYGDFEAILELLQSKVFDAAEKEVIAEVQWQEQRLIVAHDHVRSADETAAIDAKIVPH